MVDSTRASPSAPDRASANDLMQLAADSGPTPMQVAGVLLLEGAEPASAQRVLDVLARRAASVPRLRQRLVRAPFGCGRPVWVDDPGFDVWRHVSAEPCPEPGDEPAVLQAALRQAGRRLPRSRPLWSITMLTGVRGGRSALVVVLHHVVADGVGALALLAALADGPAGDQPRPRAARSTRGQAQVVAEPSSRPTSPPSCARRTRATRP